VYRAPRRRQPDPRFELRELGENNMVSRALATLDLVDHDDARPAFPAVYLEGHAVLATLLAYLAALRLGHAWLGEPPRQPGAWPARCASRSADQ
jgi:hypothetical protein